jgi:hypothetical protein
MHVLDFGSTRGELGAKIATNVAIAGVAGCKRGKTAQRKAQHKRADRLGVRFAEDHCYESFASLYSPPRVGRGSISEIYDGKA